MPEHFKQKDLRNLGPVDTNIPAGSRFRESFEVDIPGGTHISIRSVPERIDESKRAQQNILGLEPVMGDPNSVEPHQDVIRATLLAKMKDESLPLEDRQSAERLFNQLYPPASDRTALTDLERRGVEYEVKTIKVSG
jgi:hypothetical protein